MNIASLVKDKESLVEMQLSKSWVTKVTTRITDRGVEFFIRQIAEWRTLKVDISHNKLSDSCKRVLFKKLMEKNCCL